MRSLSIDLETYSPHDIKKCGVYKYIEDVEILLFGYAFDDDPIRVIDFTDWEQLPDEVIQALTRPDIIKTAFNAQFEINVLQKAMNIKLELSQWQCTALHSRYLGLPGDLAGVSKLLWPNNQDKQKMAEGKALIKFFCKPCKPTKKNGGRTRNMPSDNPEKWAKFVDYNRQDVEVERNIKNKLACFPVPEIEQVYWQMDQVINARGVCIDPVLVGRAIEMNELQKERLLKEACELTGLDNPNSVAQLKEWLQASTGEEIKSLSKTTLPDIIESTDDPTTLRMLEIRQLLSKTSVKKYQAIVNSVCEDGRIRGLLQFYGASRTGRWAGRIVQVQNLPKINMEEEELDAIRGLVKKGYYESVEILGPDNSLSQLIRTALVAEIERRRKLIVCDLSAIEARMIAWLAGEEWALEEFAGKGKIYEATAAKMYHKDISEITKHSPERAKGKIATLACGYGGSVGALIAFGAERDGLTEKEMKSIVYQWRAANVKIVRYWWDVGNAAMATLKDHLPHSIGVVTYSWSKGTLFCQLPSGRKLAYNRAKIVTGKFDKDVIEFEGQDQTTKKWTKIQTYGPKLVENIVQAASRDVLAGGLLEAEKQGLNVVLHVHDEIVCEVPEDFDKDILFKIMTTVPAWAKGLPLNAEAQEAQYYCK